MWLPGSKRVLSSQICANLDAEEISLVQEEVQQLQSHVPQPRKQHDLCQERVQVRSDQLVSPSHLLDGKWDPQPC